MSFSKSFFQDRQNSIILALGAGLAIGAVGVMTYQRLNRRLASNSHELSSQISQIEIRMCELRETVEAWKEQQKRMKSALKPSVTFEKELVNETDKENDDEDNNEDTFETASMMSRNSSSFYSAIYSEDENDDAFLDFDEDLHDLAGVVVEKNENEEKNEKENIIINDDNNNDETAKTMTVPNTSNKSHGKSNENSEKSEDVQQLFLDVDFLVDSNRYEESLQKLRKNESKLAQNGEFLWRLCRSIYHCSNNSNQQLDLAIEKGQKSVQLVGEISANSHKWLAIVLGRKSQFLGTKEKIANGHTFKEHADKAASLAPNDHTVHHLLGRFCYEVSELSWYERRAASLLFGSPPSSSFEEARNHFELAEKFANKPLRENRLFLAKTFAKLNDRNQALLWAKRAGDLPNLGGNDEKVREEVEQLIKTLSK